MDKATKKKVLKEMDDFMKMLRESSRRKILRLIEKEQITWENKMFVYLETSLPV
jgi:hypothetical protein